MPRTRAARERAVAQRRAGELAARYGFRDDETLGDVHDRMTPADAAKFERLLAVVFPNGCEHGCSCDGVPDDGAIHYVG